MLQALGCAFKMARRASTIDFLGPRQIAFTFGVAAAANTVRLEVHEVVWRRVDFLEEPTIPAVLRHNGPRLVDISLDSRYMHSRYPPSDGLRRFASETIFSKERAGDFSC